MWKACVGKHGEIDLLDEVGPIYKLVESQTKLFRYEVIECWEY